ncbi:hypothetical protein PR048_005062 [Dryococelus australis]|uniref:Uncharacterized protein n=1 Tax=Dryococelus australis TaxID=614101 RepID=A0ABQ9I761_9NEOP|nr:hypothetical protein PR048_005062 [Dryococelus australis]
MAKQPLHNKIGLYFVELPTRPWKCLFIDEFGPLARPRNGHNCILVAVGGFTKFMMVPNIHKRYETFARLLGFNNNIKIALTIFHSHDHCSWDESLASLALALNSVQHSATIATAHTFGYVEFATRQNRYNEGREQGKYNVDGLGWLLWRQGWSCVWLVSRIDVSPYLPADIFRVSCVRLEGRSWMKLDKRGPARPRPSTTEPGREKEEGELLQAIVALLRPSVARAIYRQPASREHWSNHSGKSPLFAWGGGIPWKLNFRRASEKCEVSVSGLYSVVSYRGDPYCIAASFLSGTSPLGKSPMLRAARISHP